MPAAVAPQSGSVEGLAIGAGVLVLSALFAWRGRVERSRRDDTLNEVDRSYFAHKDRRRAVGTALLSLIGAGMIAGSRIDYRASRAAGRWFLAVWLGVGVLLIASLVLAMADWVANRRYALRLRRALLEERRSLVADELRRRAYGTNGRGAEHPL